MIPESLLASLRSAVDRSPEDLTLRMHLAETLSAAGQQQEAVRQAAEVLRRDPANLSALTLVARSAQQPGVPTDVQNVDKVSPTEVLRRLDAELVDVVPPQYTDSSEGSSFEVERTGVRLADVGGMAEVKQRLEAGVLAVLRNPELGRLYGKSIRGGLLLYGPPGCGKTFIARALAGEMNAKFLPVSLADVLDMFVGQSERNVRDLFETARRNAPCVIFLDEIDALGHKRSQNRNSAARGSVNQLLSEMDGVAANNEGVFVLGATNHPWDVDVALRRPGRFDRMQVVLPPDAPAREAILRYHLRDRPIANIDVVKLARKTDGLSGADLAYLCEVGAERALADSARSGVIRMIEMRDLEAASVEVRSSVGPWLEAARNVAQFANESGSYDDLLAYLRRRRLL